MSKARNKTFIILNVMLAVLECIAMVYLINLEGMPIFRYYTVNSNAIQLIVSVWYLWCFIRKKEIPTALTVMHLVASVCLTITFIIAAFVLMPQSTFAYYFLNDVAPIVHFFGPLLSVVTLMLAQEKIPRFAVGVPAALSLAYGFIALFLNWIKVLKGPYFFLEVYSTPGNVIAMWFVIILLLCVALTAGYMFIRSRIDKRREQE